MIRIRAGHAMNSPKQNLSKQQSGFTLIELAVGLLIVGIIVAGFLAPLATQLENRKRQITQDRLDEARDALIGFAITTGRLPCADSVVDADGLETDEVPDEEDRGIDPCGQSATIGLLPYKELGVVGLDAWGRRLGYAVSPDFTKWLDESDPTCGGIDFDLCATPEVILSDGYRGEPDDPTSSPARAVAAIVFSLGANGRGAFWGGTNPAESVADFSGVGGGHRDEQENADGDLIFVDRTYSRGASGCEDNQAISAGTLCEFDDMFEAISAPVLVERMVRAGRLP